MMKKIIILLFSVIMSLIAFTVAGCGGTNGIVENSLKYNIDTYYSRDKVDGSFNINVNSGIVVNVKFTVTGYDQNNNKIWSENISKYYKGIEPDDSPYKISFSCGYYYDSSVDALKRTSYITVTEIKLIKENTNEWMGWTFGALSAVATFAVIALFVISKLNSISETSSENPES